MLKIASSVAPYDGTTHAAAVATAAQRVMIVNGCMGTLELIEMILRAGHYDVVFVESSQNAYSQIKRVQPDLVILCMRLDQLDGFHLLSMLKIDEKTCNIPVLTYATTEQETERFEEEDVDIDQPSMFLQPAELMN
jgi:PleD family two-component response regulator